MRLNREAAILLTLWAIATAANIAKPYHIDDAAHLLIAQWIAAHPLHPMQGVLNWTGTPQPISATNQPHLYFYALALWGRLFGWSELAMHTLQALFTGLCLWLMHRLARALAPQQALFLTAALALNPAFIVGQNLMVDVPLLASWLGFFAALAERRFALAGLACAAACLIKYSSLCLLPILALAPLLAQRRPWALLIPVGALALWSGFNWWDYGGIHLATAFHAGQATYTPRPERHFELARRLVKSVIAWTVAAGALTPFGIIALRPRPWVYAALAAGLGLLAAAVLSGLLPGSWADRALWLGFAASGLALLPLLRWPKDADGLFLWLWVAGTSAFYILFAPCIAARHVLLILPALALLAARLARIPRPAQVFTLGMSALLSLGLAVSDERFAAFYRDEAARLPAAFPGQTITAAGHWGWQYYAGRHGMAELDLAAPPRAGLIAIPREVDHELPPALPLRRLRTDTANLSPLDPFCTARPSRFYLSYTFRGPWSLSRDCTVSIDLYALPTS